MIPDATGRYCNSCKKSVIDFTEKSDEQIQQFIIANLNQSLCGRFKNTQVQRIVIDLPENIFSIKMPLWMRFLVACLLIFGISIFPFETSIAGNPHTATSFYQGEPIKADTAKKPRILKRKKKSESKYSIIVAGIEVPYVPIINEVLGGMWNEPQPTIKSMLDLPQNTFCELSFNTMQKESNKDSNPLPHKEHPGPTPYMPTEFILPSILLFRRKNNSNPMD